jgi:hypothetical protein
METWMFLMADKIGTDAAASCNKLRGVYQNEAFSQENIRVSRVRKYMNIRLQKRFKFKERGFFQAETHIAPVLQLQANTGFACSRFTS